MALFQAQVEQVRFPELSSALKQLNASKINPFEQFNAKVLNPYLQGQHNIGVAEAKNALLSANTRQATLDIMDQLRAKGLTETQLEDAKAQEILNKNTEMDFRKAQENAEKARTKIALAEEARKLGEYQYKLKERFITDSIIPQIKMDIAKWGAHSTSSVMDKYVSSLNPKDRDLARRLILPHIDITKLTPSVETDPDSVDFLLNRGDKVDPNASYEQMLGSNAGELEAARVKAETMGLKFKDGKFIVDDFDDTLSKFIKDTGLKDKAATAFIKAAKNAQLQFGKTHTPKRILDAVYASVPIDNDWYELSKADDLNLNTVKNKLKIFDNELAYINALGSQLKHLDVIRNAKDSFIASRTNYLVQRARLEQDPTIPPSIKEDTLKRLSEEFTTSQVNTMRALQQVMEGAKFGNSRISTNKLLELINKQDEFAKKAIADNAKKVEALLKFQDN